MKKKTVIFVLFVIFGATAAGLNSEGIQMVLNVDDRIVLPVPRHKALSVLYYYTSLQFPGGKLGFSLRRTQKHSVSFSTELINGIFECKHREASKLFLQGEVLFRQIRRLISQL